MILIVCLISGTTKFLFKVTKQFLMKSVLIWSAFFSFQTSNEESIFKKQTNFIHLILLCIN